jgi:hypothetical protein
MEMPTNCAKCDLRYRCSESRGIYGFDAIREMMRLDTVNDKREDEHCLFVCSLPEGHGRLVDEKSVRWAIDDIVLEIANRTGRVGMTKDETMEYINSLCTIVPAEAERSET